MAATVAPEAILRELSDLWVSLGKHPEGEGGMGVLRACALTLVVAAAEDEDIPALSETIAALMPEHPSRAIVVRLEAAAGKSLTARVFAQCWMPFGIRRQICCEQIDIASSEASLSDVPGLVRPLAAPDLPVVLWCRNRRLFGMPVFSQFAELAHKVVLDSATFARPVEVMEQFAAWRGPCALADLAWTRLTRWRQTISQVFENREYLDRVPGIKEVVVSHGGPEPTVGAWYMAAWLLDSLRRAGASPQLRFQGGGEDPKRISKVEMATPDFRFSVARVEGTCAEVRTGDIVHRSALPKSTDYSLMREELTIAGPDQVYERTLAAAAQLALSSKHV